MTTSRRQFFGQAAAVSAGVALSAPAVEALAAEPAPAGLVDVVFEVNGERRTLRRDQDLEASVVGDRELRRVDPVHLHLHARA